jgi:hypothetical protein
MMRGVMCVFLTVTLAGWQKSINQSRDPDWHGSIVVGGWELLAQNHERAIAALSIARQQFVQSW